MDLNWIKDEVIKIRKELHKIPEVGYNEFKTSKLIKEYLTNYGYSYEEVAHTGVVAVKKGKKKEAIAFRTDIDGLAVLEKTNLEFSSLHKGNMHACGHDGHMAILLGFAYYLSELKEVENNIVFIFQPAEEGPGGAEKIIDAGIFEKYNIKAIFGLHIYPEILEGKIALVNGPLMARSGSIDININTKSSHGAMPQNGIDGLLVSSYLIQAYQSIISRNIDPNESAILTIGKIIGGETRNVIAGNVCLEGTLRAFSDSVYHKIKERIRIINKGIEQMFNCEIKSIIEDYYPTVINDDNLYKFLKNTLNNNDIISLKPMMISEDFSYYQKKVPGFFMMLGSKNEKLGFTHPLHSCYFNFNEDILIKGIKTYINIFENYKI